MSERLANLYPAHLETMKRRHDSALEDAGFDSVVIFGGAEHGIFLDDQPYPFKVNPHFKSWVPVLDNPNCFLVYRPGEKPRLIFFQPVDYWYKPAERPSAYWVDHFDIRTIADPSAAKDELQAGGRSAFIGEWSEEFESWALGERNPKAMLDALHFERAYKTDYELECMREATVLGVRGHIAAERAFREGASEFEIHLAYLRATRHSEQQLPYGNIIAFNENAAVLHYQNLQREKPEELHSFLIDAGATFHGYASDITRTYTSNGNEFGEMVQAMDRAEQELCAAVRPGVDYKEIHFLAHRKIGAILSDFGIVKLPGDDAFEKKLTSTFFPHGIGHLIGLQVHDVGGFSADRKGTTIPKPEGHPYLRLTRKIEPRMVFTIEPGLYFIDSLLSELKKKDEAKHVDWDKVEHFRKYGGVRIEDDIAVTESGFENMTRNEWGRGGY